MCLPAPQASCYALFTLLLHPLCHLSPTSCFPALFLLYPSCTLLHLLCPRPSCAHCDRSCTVCNSLLTLLHPCVPCSPLIPCIILYPLSSLHHLLHFLGSNNHPLHPCTSSCTPYIPASASPLWSPPPHTCCILCAPFSPLLHPTSLVVWGFPPQSNRLLDCNNLICINFFPVTLL